MQGLDGNDTLTEVFTYTLTDGDNDTSTTTLTITINGSDDPVAASSRYRSAVESSDGSVAKVADGASEAVSNASQRN